MGYYIQDDWKLTRSLTANVRGCAGNISVGQLSVITGSPILISQPVSRCSPGKMGTRAARSILITKTSRPRIGLAWHATDRIVLRAGYEMFYTPSPGPGAPGAAALSVRPQRRGHGQRRPIPARRRERHRRPPARLGGVAAGEPPLFVARWGRGFDRPLERAFVQIQRRLPSGGSQSIDSDLGLAVLWRVNESSLYLARWEPRLNQPLGAHRFRITANRYVLTSNPFDVSPNEGLRPRRVAAPAGKVAVVLDYPRARSGRRSATRCPTRGEPYPPPAQRRLGPGDLHRRRPADHRSGGARRALRGQRKPRKLDPIPAGAGREAGAGARRRRVPERDGTDPTRREFLTLRTRARQAPLALPGGERVGESGPCRCARFAAASAAPLRQGEPWCVA